MKTLPRRWRRPPDTITVTLYGRTGCHLCADAAKPVSRAVAATPGAALRQVNIEGDANLEERYGLRIPVVTAAAGGAERVIAEGKVSDIRLRRALAALVAGET